MAYFMPYKVHAYSSLPLTFYCFTFIPAFTFTFGITLSSYNSIAVFSKIEKSENSYKISADSDDAL